MKNLYEPSPKPW